MIKRSRLISVLLDSSAWIAFAIECHPQHKAVKEVVSAQDEPNSILFCRATQQSFLRLMTTSAVFKPHGLPALTNEQAWEIFESLESMPVVAIIGETVAFNNLWKKLSGLSTSSPKVWMDAYLAAFAIAHDYSFLTLDSDFKRYPKLKLELI